MNYVISICQQLHTTDSLYHIFIKYAKYLIIIRNICYNLIYKGNPNLNMKEKNKNRNIYIDLMKGLLITLVVIGHLPYFEYDSRTLVLIYSFHMHAFLIIGGILSHVNENTKLSTILYKRITGTLIPYFVFYLITFLIVPTTTEQKLNAIPVVLKGIGIPPDHALNLPLWFLTFYFVAMTTFEIIQFISYKIALALANAVRSAHHKTTTHMSDPTTSMGELCEPALATLLTLIFISIIMRASFIYARIYKLPRLPYNIEIAGFCLGFVFLGNVLGKIIPNIKGRMTSALTKIFLKIIFMIVVAFALILITKTWYEYSMWNGRIDLNARDYKNAFYMYVDAILGFITFSFFTYIIYIISTFAKKRLDFLNNNLFDDSLFKEIPNIFYTLLGLPSKMFSYLGKNSLYILAFHVPSVFYTNAFIIPFLPQTIQELLSHNSIISILILTSLGIGFSLLVHIILQLVLSLFHKN